MGIRKIILCLIGFTCSLNASAQGDLESRIASLFNEYKIYKSDERTDVNLDGKNDYTFILSRKENLAIDEGDSLRLYTTIYVIAVSKNNKFELFAIPDEFSGLGPARISKPFQCFIEDSKLVCETLTQAKKGTRSEIIYYKFYKHKFIPHYYEWNVVNEDTKTVMIKNVKKIKGSFAYSNKMPRFFYVK